VACQSNARFAADCGVMLYSLLAENPDERFVVHFLHDEGLPASDRARLAEIVYAAGSAWEPLLIGENLISGFPTLERYGGVTAWFRMLLPRVLPSVDRVLYLDADLMILRALRALWETDLDGRCLAAVTNPVLGQDRRRVVRDLGLPDPGRYFNSGMMVMDLARLRDTGLMLEAERIARERLVPTPWADQEPLNAALWTQRLDLHPRWNVMNPCFDLAPRQLPWPRAQVMEARRDPAIIHFIGPYKPWHHRLRHRYAGRYFEYLEQTPWRSRPLEGRTIRNRILRSLPPRAAMRYEEAEYAAKRARSTAGPAVFHAGRRALSRSPGVYAWARAAFRAARPRSAPPALVDVLDAVADSRPGAWFVQIGSNDADHGDPLRPYVETRGWHGILVEPVPYVFDRLRARYAANDRITPVNAAIAAEDGRLPFYYVPQSDDPDLPEWYDQIGSFVRENVLHPYHAENIPRLAERIVCEEVPCLTFDSLLRLHPVPRLDIVHVDAEGYDDQILPQIDLAALRPVVLLYEHQHLSEPRRAAVLERLHGGGYDVLDLGPDALAVRRDAPFIVRLAAHRHRRPR
jgi:FkbM family methyltransferase